MFKIVMSILLVLALCIGCATIFKGTTGEVNAKALTGTADVYVDGIKAGQTPMTVKISCNNQHTIELKKADGTTKAFRTDQSLGAGWLIVDIIPGGIISIVVDAVTGSWYYVTPKEVTIDNPIKEK